MSLGCVEGASYRFKVKHPAHVDVFNAWALYYSRSGCIVVEDVFCERLQHRNVIDVVSDRNARPVFLHRWSRIAFWEPMISQLNAPLVRPDDSRH